MKNQILFSEKAINIFESDLKEIYHDSVLNSKHKIIFSSDRMQYGVCMKNEYEPENKDKVIMFIGDSHIEEKMYETTLLSKEHLSINDTDMFLVMDNGKAHIL